MGWIYKLLFPNGKGYVGKTTAKRLSKRLRAHKNAALRNRRDGCRLLWAAIRKYGWRNVTKVVLKRKVPKERLNEEEVALIAEHNTLAPNGYNLTPGGDGNPMTDGVEARAQLSKTCSTPENKAAVSERTKKLHSDPAWKAAWLKKHTEAHRKPAVRAKMVKINKDAWAKPGARKARGDAIKAALNTDANLATRAEQHAKLIATKAKQREELLSKLPPAERLKHERYLERKRVARQKRVAARRAPGSQ